MTRYYMFLPLIPGLMLSSAAPARGQEQGRPRGLPASAEFAEQFFQNGRTEVVGMAASGCPDESEWHRNVLTRLLDPARRTDALIVEGSGVLWAFLKQCEWAPAHAWFRDVAMDAAISRMEESVVYTVISAIDDTWTPADRELLLRFALRADIESVIKTEALRTVSRNLNGPEKVNWFFDAYEAGALMEGYARQVVGFIGTGESADAFVRRGAQAMAQDPDRLLAPLVLQAVMQSAAIEPGVSRTAAAAALATLDRLAGRPEFYRAVGYRAAVARAAGGGS